MDDRVDGSAVTVGKRATVVLHTPLAMVGFGVSLVLIVIGVLLAAIPWSTPTPAQVGAFLIILGVIATCLSPLLAGGAIQRAHLERLRRELPGAQVFLTYLGATARTIVTDLEGADAATALHGVRAWNSLVVCDARGFALWGRRGDDLVRYLLVPRERIVHAVGDSYRFRSGLSAPTLITFLTADGRRSTDSFTVNTRDVGAFNRVTRSAEFAQRWLREWASGANPEPYVD